MKNDDNCAWYHWLWMAPCAIAISPIGTGLAIALLDLNFVQSLALIAAQICCFFVMGILSNFGDGFEN